MYNIAIDGPSGSGKSTVAKMLSARLNILYLDTGAMYRAMALKAIACNVNCLDAVAVDNILSSTEIDIKYNNGIQEVYLDNINVSTQIREHHISKAASDISSLQNVRIKLVEMQKKIASKYSCILDGRDIGTVVLPDAKYKFFITADVEIRAKRRYDELIQKKQDVKLDKVLSDLILRDFNDSNREHSPLRQAKDALLIDTTNLDIEKVVEQIISIIKE